MHVLFQLVLLPKGGSQKGLLFEANTPGSEGPMTSFLDPHGRTEGRTSLFVIERTADASAVSRLGVLRAPVGNTSWPPPGDEAGDLDSLSAANFVTAVEEGWDPILCAAEALWGAYKEAHHPELVPKFVDFASLGTDGKTQVVHVGLFQNGRQPVEEDDGQRAFQVHGYFVFSTVLSVQECAALLPTLPEAAKATKVYLKKAGATGPMGLPADVTTHEMEVVPSPIALPANEEVI